MDCDFSMMERFTPYSTTTMQGKIKNKVREIFEEAMKHSAASTSQLQQSFEVEIQEDQQSNTTNPPPIFPHSENLEVDKELPVDHDEFGDVNVDNLDHEEFGDVNVDNLACASEVESSECEESDAGESQEVSFQDCLATWAANFNIQHVALSELLKILNKHGMDVPNDPRTLLSTPKDLSEKDMCGGKYIYLGVAKTLKGKTHLQKKCKIYLNGVAKKSVGSTEQVCAFFPRYVTYLGRNLSFSFQSKIGFVTSYEVSFIGRENLELTSATKLYGIIVWEGKVTQMIQNIIFFYNKHIRSGAARWLPVSLSIR